MADQAELLEQLEVAVDRGDVHRRGLGVHLLEDLVGRRMAETLDRTQHQLALRGEPVAPRAQLLVQVVGHGRLTGGRADPRGAAGAPAPWQPCRRPRAGRPRPGRTCDGRRSTPWQCPCVRRRRCASSIFAPVDLADVDLDEAGVVSEQELDLAGGLRTEEAGLDRRVSDLVAVGVDDPPAAHVVEERPAVVGEDALLAELEAFDRGVVAVAVATPGAQEPRDFGALRVEVVRQLEGHVSSQVSGWSP